MTSTCVALSQGRLHGSLKLLLKTDFNELNSLNGCAKAPNPEKGTQTKIGPVIGLASDMMGFSLV